MKNGERLSLEQIQAFLKASGEFRFEASKRKEVYEWVTRTLVEQEYSGQPREARGTPCCLSHWPSASARRTLRRMTRHWKCRSSNVRMRPGRYGAMGPL